MDRVAKSAAEVAPARPWFPRRALTLNWRRIAGGHVPPLLVLLAATLWLARGFLLTSQLPAGTDMLGFVSRSAQNATLSNALSLWTPTSLGYPRTWSLDNVMGALTILTGSPIVTVKLLDILVIFATGASGYLLAWSWYRRRTVAFVAGLLYMLSQAALSRWGSGQLNVAMAIALAPVLLWSWSQCLQRFTVRRALTLALLVTGMLLIRLDMLLYVAPFMALYTCFAIPYASPASPVRNALKTVAVALPAALALNIYQILPVAIGYGPKWLSSGQLFDLQQIATHTLSAYQSLLGFGREIGYLAFTGQQTWFSFPFLQLWAYYAAASVVVACAFVALAWEHGRRTIFLAVMAIVAVFLAKGSDPPFGNLYTWAINHIPIVSDIRDPNRWLIFEALALGIMAGITVDRIVSRGPGLLARIHVPRRAGRVAAGTFAVVLVAAMLVQVAPTLAIGLKTWEPPADEVQLLDSLHGTAPGVLATIPYDQSTMFVDTPAYSGYEHDLGYESPLFTGVPTLGTGDWDQRTSDYIAYTSSLLGAGDPAFVRLLASVGVSDLVSLNEPIQAAQVLDAARGSYYEQTAAQGMSGLVPVTNNTGGTVYALPAASPLITFRPNIAVVLGGRAELASFADLPGIDASSWAAFDADDLIAAGGLPRLLSLINGASLIVAGPSQDSELAALAASPLAKLSGITSDPQPGRQTLLLPSDQSTFLGALADPNQGIPLPATTVANSTFTLSSAQTVEVWAHIESSADAATITVSVDGRTAYSHTPLAVGADTFAWVPAATVSLPAGHHVVTIDAERSEFGDTYEVDETRVVSSAARLTDQSQIDAALQSDSGHVAYAFDLDSPGSSGQSAAAFEPVTKLPGTALAFWAPTAEVTVSPDVTETGAPAADVAVPAGRDTYAAVQHSFAPAQNWSHRADVFLDFDGTDSGLTYQVVVTFGNGAGDAYYSVKDASMGWRTVALSTDNPSVSDNPNWAAVSGIRIALPSKDSASSFRVGVPALSGALTSLAEAYATPYATAGTAVQLLSATTGGDCTAIPAASPAASISAGVLTVDEPTTALGGGCQAVVLPPDGIHALPVITPKITAGSPYEASFTSSNPGVLVFNQGYDPGWLLSTGGQSETPIPAQSVVNGYLLAAGSHSITLTYSGNEIGLAGLLVSVLVLLGISVVMWRVRPRPEGTPARAATTLPRWLRALLITAAVAVVLAVIAVGFLESGASRVQFAVAVLSGGSALFLLQDRWWLPWAAGLAVIAACPVVALLGGSGNLDALAIFAVALIAMGLIRLALDSIPHPPPEATSR
jgi:hypothetical protein